MSEPWWRGAVLYQIYPRSFADSDGDGLGDFAGIVAHLDHVAGLGVDGIWLSPFFVSPMRDFGYDIADYCAVDPRFGSLADFDALVDAAHRRGLKLIIDQVYSHTSSDHPWFTESRASRTGKKADWYVWADAKPDGSPPNNWQSMFGGPAWTWDTRRRQYYLHNFLSTQPDLNFHEPAVREAILNVARFWLDRGVDGFRLDVANYYLHDPLLRDNPPAADTTDAVKPYFMQRHLHDKSQPGNIAIIEGLRATLDTYSERMTVAEIACDDPLARMAEYTAPGRLSTAYSFVFLGPAPSATEFSDAIRTFEAKAGGAWPSWAFSNHDSERIVSRWPAAAPDSPWPRTLIALLTALRGTAFLYQGEELGLPQADVPFDRLVDPDGLAFWPAYKGRDGCRTPFPWNPAPPHGGFTSGEPWLPVDHAHLPLAAGVQAADPDSTLAFTRRWLAWRRTQPALRHGTIVVHSAASDVVMFERRLGPDRLLFLANFADRQVRQPWPDRVAPAPLFLLGGEAGPDVCQLPPRAGFIGRLPG